MKSNDFNTNIDEGILSNIYGAATNNAGYLNKQETKQFGSVFKNRLLTNYKSGINVDDFLDSYFAKNGIDKTKITGSYASSLERAKNRVLASNYSNGSIDELGKVVYNIGSLNPGNTTQGDLSDQPGNVGGKARAASGAGAGAKATNQDPAAGDGIIDPNTNQIISKIRSMKNSPEEIDDLVDIIAMSMIKLYKISPKNYRRIIMKLVNNGGTPTMPTQQTTAPVTTPNTTNSTSAPNYSKYLGGQQYVTPSIIQYPSKFNTKPPAQSAVTAQPTQQITNQEPNTLQPNLSQAQPEPAVQSNLSTNEPTFSDKPLPSLNAKNTEPKLGNSTGNISRTPDSMGRIDPTDNQAMRDISRNALDKRINARQNVQNKITTRGGLPK
jgi:hypothetical protein